MIYNCFYTTTPTATTIYFVAFILHLYTNDFVLINNILPHTKILIQHTKISKMFLKTIWKVVCVGLNQDKLFGAME